MGSLKQINIMVKDSIYGIMGAIFMDSLVRELGKGMEYGQKMLIYFKKVINLNNYNNNYNYNNRIINILIFILEIMIKILKMVMEFTDGQMGKLIKGILKMI